MSTIEWTKLVRQNRVKEAGVSWTKEEREAIRSGISPDDVRAGILKKEDEEKVEPIERMKKAELAELAREKGIEFNEDAVTRQVLIAEIKKKS